MKKSIPSAQEAPVLEHFRAGRVEFPEVSLPRGAVLSGHLYEAVVEAEVVSDRVLPRRPALAVVGELLDDVVADFAQSEHLVGGLGDGHCDEGNVGVRWLDVVLVALRGRVGLLAVPLLRCQFLLSFICRRCFSCPTAAGGRTGRRCVR